MDKLQRQYNGVYHQAPALAEGATIWKMVDKGGHLVYRGSDPIIARLMYNMGKQQLVPVGETMETMP